MSNADTLDTPSQIIDALTEEGSKARRRMYANTAYAALRTLRGSMPPANAEEAARRGYELGLFAALRIVREAQRDVDDPLRKASYRDDVRGASGASSALVHHADTVVTEFEKRINAELRVPYKKETP